MVKHVIKGPRERLSAARGYVVLDEDLAFLEQPLRNQNFMVTTLPSGMLHEDVLKLLSNRVFITKNFEPFEYDAPVHDFGLISVRSLRLLEPAQEDSPTAKVISRAWKDFSLTSERFRYLLRLQPSGEHVFERLE